MFYNVGAWSECFLLVKKKLFYFKETLDTDQDYDSLLNRTLNETLRISIHNFCYKKIKKKLVKLM